MENSDQVAARLLHLHCLPGKKKTQMYYRDLLWVSRANNQTIHTVIRLFKGRKIHTKNNNWATVSNIKEDISQIDKAVLMQKQNIYPKMSTHCMLYIQCPLLNIYADLFLTLLTKRFMHEQTQCWLDWCYFPISPSRTKGWLSTGENSCKKWTKETIGCCELFLTYKKIEI